MVIDLQLFLSVFLSCRLFGLYSPQIIRGPFRANECLSMMRAFVVGYFSSRNANANAASFAEIQLVKEGRVDLDQTVLHSILQPKPRQ
jgi:hypothetical protein